MPCSLGRRRQDSETAMEIEFAELSDCGPVREHNEDLSGIGFLRIRNRGATGDGCLHWRMASGARSEAKLPPDCGGKRCWQEFAKPAAGEIPSTLLASAVKAANTRVYEAGHGAIATTLVA